MSNATIVKKFTHVSTNHLLFIFDICLGIIFVLDCFTISHMSRHENRRSNEWVHKHQAIMLIILYLLFPKPMLSSNAPKAELIMKLATNEGSSAC